MNAVVLVSMFIAGWWGVSGWEPWLAPSRTAVSGEVVWAPVYDRSAMWADAICIVTRNIAAFLVVIALGASSGGIYGWLVLALNGYAIGSAVSALAGEAPRLVPLVLSFAPLELGAMVLGATIGQCLGVHAVLRVVRGRAIPVAGVSRAVGVGLTLLALAGVLEADAMQRSGAVLR